MNTPLCLAALLASVALAGCGTLSQVDQAGLTDKPVFPEVKDVTFKTGSYPNIENLRQVRDGLSRDQLYDLLGRPHFSEGFQVREWDYLFHFNTAQGLQSCQFKVLFDQDKLARSFHWQPAECARVLEPASATKKPIKPFSLSSDVGFAFGSAVLSAAGLNAVREVATTLSQASEVRQVTIIGHTDRIGNDAANLRLSQQRAQAVRVALAKEGVAASTLWAQGVGETQPVVQCDQSNRAELIACLAPNRRVDIAVQGEY